MRFDNEQLYTMEEIILRINTTTPPRGPEQLSGKERLMELEILYNLMRESELLTNWVKQKEIDDKLYQDQIADIINTMKLQLKTFQKEELENVKRNIPSKKPNETTK